MNPKLCDLGEVKRLAIVCDDCGRRRVWTREQVARAQLRWGVKTAVQLGSRLTCNHCTERGQGGHNPSIYINEEPPPHVPRDTRGLLVIEAMTVSCLDCGHTVRLDKDALSGMPAVKTVDELWRNAFCQPCRDAGSTTPNLCLEVDPPMPLPGQKQAAPQWSTAEVFTENRSDPFDTLPRRRMFGAPMEQ